MRLLHLQVVLTSNKGFPRRWGGTALACVCVATLLPDSEFRPFLWGATGISPDSTGFFGTLDPGLNPLLRSVNFDGFPLDAPTSDWRGYPTPEDEPGERVMFLLCALDTNLPPGWTIREVWAVCVQEVPIGNAFVNARLPN